jgi:hypothetical protein
VKTFAISAVLALLMVSSPLCRANDADDIEFIINAVGTSECVFIRNGKEHSADDAEKHLRMKYRRGKKWVTSAESFIDRLASKSSFSGKPYLMRCGQQAPQPAAAWMMERLAVFRQGSLR